MSVTCPLCGPGQAVIQPFRYAFRGRYLCGVKCSTCALVFVHPQPTPEEIQSLYVEEYFTQHTDSCGAHGREAYMEAAERSGSGRAEAARKLDRLARQYCGRRGDALEIGSGPGFLLAELRGLGWRARGLEISEYAVRHARNELGLDVTLGTISAEHFEPEQFDFVFMGDVLEHLPDPVDSLRIVSSWIRPTGVVLIAVPATLNLLSARLGMALYGRTRNFKTLHIPPYHLFEYTPRTLTRVVAAGGLHVRRIEQSTVPLRRMGLRGSRLENLGKGSLQILAGLTSRLCNAGGDRLLAVVGRASSSSRTDVTV
jgi:SAM-dependent methyltransferase